LEIRESLNATSGCEWPKTTISGSESNLKFEYFLSIKDVDISMNRTRPKNNTINRHVLLINVGMS